MFEKYNYINIILCISIEKVHLFLLLYSNPLLAVYIKSNRISLRQHIFLHLFKRFDIVDDVI